MPTVVGYGATMQPSQRSIPAKNDLVALIEADHRSIERALDGIARRSGRWLVPAFWALADRLVRHQLAEELVVYPELRQLPGAAVSTDRLLSTQMKLEGQLTVLERQAGQSVVFDSACRQFAAAVRQYLDEERREVLPRLTAAMDAGERGELGGRYAVVRGSVSQFHLSPTGRRTILGRIPTLAHWIRDSAAAVHRPRSAGRRIRGGGAEQLQRTSNREE